MISHTWLIIGIASSCFGFVLGSLPCGSGEFQKVGSTCVWRSKNPTAFSAAREICRNSGGYIDDEKSSQVWHKQTCDGNKDKREGNCDYLTKECRKDLCLVKKGDGRCKVMSCKSRFNFVCRRNYWRYHGKCPANHFHIAEKCYRVTDARRIIRSSDYASACDDGKEEFGQFNDEMIPALTVYIMEKVRFPLIMQASANKAIMAMNGYDSILPGQLKLFSLSNGPLYAQVLCSRNRSIDNGPSESGFGYFGKWSDGGHCSKGYTSYDNDKNYCLKLVDGESVENALTKCHEKTLVSITNEYEHSIIRLFLLKNYPINSAFTHIEEIKSGVITWQDKTNSTFHRFAASKDKARLTNRGSCVRISRNGRWETTASCSGKYICGYRLNKVKPKLSVKHCDNGFQVDNVCYRNSTSVTSTGEQIGRLPSREVARAIVEVFRSRNKKICVSRDSMYQPWATSPRGDLRENQYLVLDVDKGMITNRINQPSTSICVTLLQSIIDSRPETTTNQQTTNTTKVQKSEGDNKESLIHILFAVIGVIGFAILLGGLICAYCYCRRKRSPPTVTENAENTQGGSKKEQKPDTSIEMTRRPQRPEDQDQGEFEEIYENPEASRDY